MPASADVTVKRVRFVLNKDGDLSEAGVQAVAERKIDDAVFPAERNGGLGALIGERKQALAFSAGQDHREYIRHEIRILAGRHANRKEAETLTSLRLRIILTASVRRGAAMKKENA